MQQRRDDGVALLKALAPSLGSEPITLLHPAPYRMKRADTELSLASVVPP
jgi:hypothetical protein